MTRNHAVSPSGAAQFHRAAESEAMRFRHATVREIESRGAMILAIMPKKLTVVAHLPTTEISHRGAKTALRIDVKMAGSKKGTLSIGRGSVEWWPEFNSVNAHRASWRRFIEMMEGIPQRRSRKTLSKRD